MVDMRINLSLSIQYGVFAALATLVNLLLQRAAFIFYQGGWSIYLAMALGTLGGLAVKYFLDKKYIFGYRTCSLQDDFRTFCLYTLMGFATTLVFWGTELAFHFWWPWEGAKYLGALLGLSLGYTAKYYLDRSFVFGRRF
jgi:putative flippase GtrA